MEKLQELYELYKIDFFGVLFIIFAAFILDKVVRSIILKVLALAIRTTKTKWDDVLQAKGFFSTIAHLAPALFIYQASNFISWLAPYAHKGVYIWVIFISFGASSRFFEAFLEIYSGYAISKKRPLKGYIQIIKIFLFIVAAILTISALLNRDPWKLLSGLGALTAIILLIFKDTILSFVASIQIMSNDLIRVGDWLEIPKYNADGSVIEVALHTIKIQNWDKTITTIPTYKLTDDSFKNWRGMSEAGGRRICRSILIDQNSIHFCSEKLLQKLKKIDLFQEYLSDKENDVKTHNQNANIHTEESQVNGRRLTNIGTFRAYILAYLKQNKHLRPDLTFLVRQLEPTTQGLPIQIYVFTNDTVWANYENIQADIFDHLLAAVPEFELRVAQSPTGSDILKLREGMDYSSS